MGNGKRNVLEVMDTRTANPDKVWHGSVLVKPKLYRSSLAHYPPQDFDELGPRKRFLEIGRRFDLADDLAGVARHEYDFHPRMQGHQAFGQFAAIHPRHDYIGQQEV